MRVFFVYFAHAGTKHFTFAVPAAVYATNQTSEHNITSAGFHNNTEICIIVNHSFMIKIVSSYTFVACHLILCWTDIFICTPVSESAPESDTFNTGISIPPHRYPNISILKCRFFKQLMQTNTAPAATADFF